MGRDLPRIRQSVDPIQVLGRVFRHGILKDIAVAVALGQRPANGKGVLGPAELIRARAGVLVGRDFLKLRRKVLPDDACPLNSGQVLAVRQAAGDLDGLELARAVDQNISARIDEEAPPDLALPVIVVGEAAERGLDPAQDDGNAGKERPDLVGVNQDGPVGHAGPIGRMLVLGPRPLERRIIDKHAVDGAGREAEKEARRPEPFEIRVAFPVGALDDPDLVSRGLQDPGDDARGRKRMVGVRLAAGEDDVEARTFCRDHFFGLLIFKAAEDERPIKRVDDDEPAANEKRILEPVAKPQRRKNERPDHLPHDLDGRQHAGAAADALFFEKPGDEERCQRAQGPIADLVHQAKSQGHVDVGIYHQDQARARAKHGQEQEPFVGPDIEFEAPDQESREGQEKQPRRNIVGNLKAVEPERLLQKRAVNGPLDTPVEGQDEQENDEKKGFFPEHARPVIPERNHVEFFVIEPPGGKKNQERYQGEGGQKDAEICELHEKSTGENSDGWAEADPEHVEAVFPVLVHDLLVLVIEAVERDVEGVIGHPEEEKRGGHEIKIVRPGDEEQEKAFGKQAAPDDAGHGKAVIDPAHGKGDQERRQGEHGDDDADLHAVEPDVQKVEGD